MNIPVLPHTPIIMEDHGYYKIGATVSKKDEEVPDYRTCHTQFTSEEGKTFTGTCDSAVEQLKQLQKNSKVRDFVVHKYVYVSKEPRRLGFHVLTNPQQTMPAGLAKRIMEGVVQNH